MVSNNGPPMPMPMQVPPGHMVHQIVDENGILTHVILSPQPPGMTAPPMTYSHPTQPGVPHMHTMAAPHMHASAQSAHSAPPGSASHQCNSHAHIHPSGLPPSQTTTPSHQANHSSGAMDDRTRRQRGRLQQKINQRQSQNIDYYAKHSNSSPSKTCTKPPKVNGDSRGIEPHSGSSSSVDGQDIEEERQVIREMLSKINAPVISEIESRSAFMQLSPPETDSQEFLICPSEFKYELQLSEKNDKKYKTVYSGEATEITLKDLRPATEYHLKVCCILDDLKGEATEPVVFKTGTCEPDPPQPVKLHNRTKTSLTLRWNATADNGSKVSAYSLEWDQGRGDMNFIEVYSGLNKQHKTAKLSPSTGYRFRLAATNAIGKSEFSDVVCFYTSGSAPSLPDPPMLSDAYVKSLVISWIKRPNDDEFILQMDDEATGHGFLNVYHGTDLSFKILNLRRNTEYKFRLQAKNEEGSSQWSDAVVYKTLPDRPSAPPKPHLKSKTHSQFCITWESSKDSGGSPVTKYLLEIDAGRGFEHIYEGEEKEFVCERLMPGQSYRLRVSCCSRGGQSAWSDVLTAVTQAVAPGQCLPPVLCAKARSTSLQLKWLVPDSTGGAPVMDFEVQQTTCADDTQRVVYKGHDLECTVAGLLPGRAFQFQVRALNKAGAGPWSETLDVVSGPGVPDPPKAIVVSCRSSHGAVVSWQEPLSNGAPITEYRLEWLQQQQSAEQDFALLFSGLALSYEVRGLLPAVNYTFRVQALNSAGAGPFSALSQCRTPSSSPGAVLSLKASTAATSIQLSWKEPSANGSPISHYNIDLGSDRPLTCVQNIREHTIEDLTPETTYRIRVQAVNGIGVGAFSSPIKVVTRALPPSPPKIECLSIGPNNLKLKWGEGRNPDLVQYCLEMLRDNGSFHPVYQNTGHTHKVSKLAELTQYEFRIFASNEAGDGPYSAIYRFQTSKAPPPAVKAPKLVDLQLDSCLVEWSPLKPMGSDYLEYILQMQCLSSGARDQDYKQVYRGEASSFHLRGLQSSAEYQIRVCAVRLASAPAEEGGEEGSLQGAFSPGVTFTTQAPQPAVPTSSSSLLQQRGASSADSKPSQLSDQHWACIFLLFFALCAVVFAFLAQQIVTYTNGTSAPADSNISPEGTL
ncbi:hypothetical protein CAPTEDRAFT_151424 [Capitella teleta]|uniref:Fibronectin type-III domain-containing protein n=1 Tax=Capitella teleta TaxID=283909 RepID=R7T3N2_CAPTE|nr:hypothetical protein CAPTEDRAFT_151424 [Capitella teleta]|eukprot:ELT87402.1 hypothetical protein CAPTEDRAFT_151424 [Capitella teleta]